MLYMGNFDSLLAWHVGEPLPLDPDHDKYQTDNFTVQADEDELRYIKRLFPDMISSRLRISTWHGSIARTIVQNL